MGRAQPGTRARRTSKRYGTTSRPTGFQHNSGGCDAAATRDIIQVGQGIYNENVLIEGKSDVQLRGENAVLQGSGVGTGISIMGSNYIQVQGFLVDGYEVGILWTTPTTQE